MIEITGVRGEMMATLRLHGNEVFSVFQLLGNKENDITFSMSWAMTNCPVFLELIVYNCVGIHPDYDRCQIMIQDYKKETDRRGFTDVEVTDGTSFHIIFEAKRGWCLPEYDQLEHYSRHFLDVPNREIIILSECSPEYVRKQKMPEEINGIPVAHYSWSRIVKMCGEAYKGSSSYKEKSIISEFTKYMNEVFAMQDQLSNQVYIVSLSNDSADGKMLSYIDIVKQNGKYFYPMKGGWPKEPPNYIAFRYQGKLQSIHHVEGYTITRNMHDDISEMPDKEWDDDHYVLTLGPAIVPSRDIKNGPNINRACRTWAMLDTLLTSSTISEAVEISKARINAKLSNHSHSVI